MPTSILKVNRGNVWKSITCSSGTLSKGMEQKARGDIENEEHGFKKNTGVTSKGAATSIHPKLH